jgi:3-oxoacyl-(acyl-carrier-protein) synthase
MNLKAQPISITSLASLSPLGATRQTVSEAYAQGKTCFEKRIFDQDSYWVAALSDEALQQVKEVRASDNRYEALDETVLYAMAASRRAVSQAGWLDGDFGINIGSSRGATGLFEKHHEAFLKSGKAATLSSPTTTLGNIASWVAHDLHATGPEISHSITCSTALHALMNGVAWLRAGMAQRFLVGGSEASLTGFTLAQLQAMKIYSHEAEPFPCRALDLEKTRNTMILGEGAAVCCLELGEKPGALAIIEGIGYATERLQHAVSISAEADCFQKSMRMALGGHSPADVDVIVMHAPGTIAGDRSEYKAVAKVFGADLPLLTTSKFMIGHTFGASGMLSVEMALEMLHTRQFIPVPFGKPQSQRRPVKKVMVNAVGFGGNAVSVLLGTAPQG